MLTFRRVRADKPPASVLLEAMVVEVSDMGYGRIDVPDAPSATPDDLWIPGGTFLVGYDAASAPVCAGGVKDLGEGACEIKRMYVVPAARGKGIAGELLAALEDAARELGHTIARLDTGRHQPHAQRLYERAGYAPIGNFNANPFASFWGEKRL